jgi:surface-anchored protein
VEFIAGLTKDHADIGIAFEDGEFDLHVHIHGEEEEHEGEEEEEHGGLEYAPNEILIQLGPSSATTAPSDPSFSFLGVPGGSPIHVLSAVETTDLPFLGHATEEIDDGVFLNDELTLALKAVNGPGLFSLWKTDEFGVPTPHMTSANGINGSDFVVLTTGGHFHFDTAFTEAGVYAITLEAYATLADGVTLVSSGDVTYYFSVNMGLAPQLTLAESEQTYTEHAAAKIIDSTASVVDADSTDFEGGQLRVDIAQGFHGEDVLSVLHQGNGINQIGVSGSQITIGVSGGGTVLLGTFSGGASGEPLVIELTTDATSARITRLMRRVAFYNGSDNPTDAERAIRFVVADGDGEISDAAIRHVVVKPVNDKPMVVASGNVVNYTENGAPVVIDPSITVSDVDSPDFDLGKLTVKVASGGQSTDRFGIDAAGFFSVAGNTVSYDGTPIGTFAGTTTLNVTFNANATPEIAQELARRITYFNLSEAPTTIPRQISFTVNDGDKGISAAALGDIVNVITENDAPVLTLSNDTSAKYTENGAPVLISSAATVVDVDLLDFDGGILTVSITSNATADDVLSIKHTDAAANKVSVSGSTINFTNSSLQTYSVATFTGGNGAPLVITFNDDALKTEVQAVLRVITFVNTSEDPSTLQRTVSFTLTDGDGGTSNTVVRSVTVTAKNDAPAIDDFGPAVDYVMGGSPTQLTNSVTVADVDSADFLGGLLTVALTTGRNSLDRVEIQEGSGITVSGTVVSFNGNAFGTFSGTTTLSVSLNTVFATTDAVQALLRQLSFRTTAITTRVVTVTAKVADGDGGTSTVVSKTIDVNSGVV